MHWEISARQGFKKMCSHQGSKLQLTKSRFSCSVRPYIQILRVSKHNTSYSCTTEAPTFWKRNIHIHTVSQRDGESLTAGSTILNTTFLSLHQNGLHMADAPTTSDQEALLDTPHGNLISDNCYDIFSNGSPPNSNVLYWSWSTTGSIRYNCTHDDVMPVITMNGAHDAARPQPHAN